MDLKKQTSYTKPVVGVTGPDRGGGAAWFFTRFAIWLAGGKAKRITPANPASADEIDGLIIGGGADVDPQLYNQEREDILPDPEEEGRSAIRWLRYLLALIFYPFLYVFRKASSRKAQISSDRLRDKLELSLLQDAIKQGMPILGICRGAQLLNVHFGGELYQNIKGFYVETPQIRSIRPKKQISIKPYSKLSGIIDKGTVRVNALHNQAIKNFGDGVVAVAWEGNQLVQAIEHQTEPYVLGVQWHPEYLPHRPEQRSIFKFIVELAGVLKTKKQRSFQYETQG